MLFPVGQDIPGFAGADAGKLFQLLCGGGIDIQQAAALLCFIRNLNLRSIQQIGGKIQLVQIRRIQRLSSLYCICHSLICLKQVYAGAGYCSLYMNGNLQPIFDAKGILGLLQRELTIAIASCKGQQKKSD